MMAKSFSHIAAGVVIAEKYKLERKLGEGSMGVVWAAVNVATARQVALKLLHTPDPELRRRMQREGRNSGALRHRNIIDLYDMGETENGEPFLVMQLLTGETVADLLERRRRLDAEVAVAIGRDVARGLSAAHAVHIVHRDLKPANIFLHHEAGVDEPVVKVLDFGVAKNLAMNDGIRTATGGAVGSPLYMSPEQVRADPSVDHRADIWALGVVMFEMLTGMRPFQGDARAVFTGILTGEIPRVSRYLRKIDPGLVELVARCMRRNREERIGSAAEVADLLDGYLSSGTIAALAPGQERVSAPAAVAAAQAMPGPVAGAQAMPAGAAAAQAMPGPVVAAQAMPAASAAAQAMLPANGRMTPDQPVLPGGAAPEQGWSLEATQKLDPEEMASAEARLSNASATGPGEPGRSATAPLVPTAVSGPERAQAAQGEPHKPSPWGMRAATPTPMPPPRQRQGGNRIPGPALAALAVGVVLVLGAVVFFALRGAGGGEPARPDASLGIEGGASAGKAAAAPERSVPEPSAPERSAAQAAQVAQTAQAHEAAPPAAAPEPPSVDRDVDAGAAIGSAPATPEAPAQPVHDAAARPVATAAPAAAQPPGSAVAEHPGVKAAARTAAPAPASPQQPTVKRPPADPCAGKTGFMRTDCLRTQARKKDPYAP